MLQAFIIMKDLVYGSKFDLNNAIVGANYNEEKYTEVA